MSKLPQSTQSRTTYRGLNSNLERFNILEWRDRLDILKETRTETVATCPVCGGGNLKIRPNGAYKCWTGGCAPKDIREAIRPISEALGEDWRTDWEREQDLRQRREDREERDRLATKSKQDATERLDLDKRDQTLRQWLSKKLLTPQHRESLKARGLDNLAISAGMFRSDKDSILCPAFYGDRIIGYQRRLDNPGDGGKYIWGTWENRLESGEMPVTSLGTPIDGIANLCEGISPKPFIAHQRHGGFWIGAAGGNFEASKHFLLRILEERGISRIFYWPDSKGISNKQVFQRDRKTLAWLKSEGFECHVIDWGQLHGGAGDCDEIEPGTPYNLIPLTDYEKTGILSYRPSLTLNQRYLGNIQLPTAGLVTIISPTGTGKTDSVADEVTRLAAQGRKVIILSNRVSTGRELARRFGIEYVDQESTELSALGIALCIESCKAFGKAGIRVTRIKYDGEELPSEWQDAIVVLDEFDQVSSQMLGGSTCQKDRPYILSTFKNLIQDNLCRSDGLVIAMSADLSDIDIDFLTAIAKQGGKSVEPYLILNQWKPDHKYDAYLYNGKEAVYNQAVEILKSKPSDKCLFFSVEGAQSKSKYGTKTIEKMLHKDVPGCKVLRLDQETLGTEGHNAAIENINELAKFYDVILTSTSISSAVSLNERDRWVAVCDIAIGLVGIREYRQRLDRVREGVARHLFLPTFAKPLANGGTTYEKIEAGKSRQIKALIAQLRDSDFDINQAIDPICFRTWSKQIAQFNQDAPRYREAAIELLQSEGVRIIDGAVSDGSKKKSTNRAAGETRDKNREEDCQKRAAANLLTEEEFEVTERKRRKTETERNECDKYRIVKSLGGFTELTPELVKKHDEGIRAKWRLHFFLLFGKFAEQSDRKRLNQQKDKPLIHAPDIGGYSAKCKLLSELGIPALLKSDREVSGQSPEIQAIAIQSRARASEIKDLLGVSLPNSPIRVVQTLLKMIDCPLTQSSIKRDGGKRIRYYQWITPLDQRWEIFDLWTDKQVDHQISQVDHHPLNQTISKVDHHPGSPPPLPQLEPLSVNDSRVDHHPSQVDHQPYKKDLFRVGDPLVADPLIEVETEGHLDDEATIWAGLISEVIQGGYYEDSFEQWEAIQELQSPFDDDFRSLILSSLPERDYSRIQELGLLVSTGGIANG